MTNDIPKMMTIKETAKTGILPEHALRELCKQNKLPAIFIGKKCLINYDLLKKQLNSLGGMNVD